MVKMATFMLSIFTILKKECCKSGSPNFESMLTIPGPLHNHTYFKLAYQFSHKEILEILIQIALISLRITDTFILVSLLIYKHDKYI